MTNNFNNALAPALEAADKEELTYLIVAGDDKECARFARGNVHDMSAMLFDMGCKHDWINEVLTLVGKRLIERGQELNDILE